MRKLITATILAFLLISGPAIAINRSDLIDCLLGQQPEGIVCPIP